MPNNESKQDGLLPCPFCGADVKGVFSFDNPISGNGSHLIKCCSIMSWDYLLDDYCHKNSINGKSKTKLKIIARWNGRKTT